GTLIMAVIWDACPYPELVKSADEAVIKCTDSCRNIRMDDPGILSLAGMSAGNRSSVQFDWARNFTKPGLTDDDIASLRYQQASAFALLWNLACNIFPDEVIDTLNSRYLDFDKEEVWGKRGSIQVDFEVEVAGGQYSVFCEDEEIVFRSAEMAPPSGVCARNYARYVHFEHSPHPFIIVWNTSRIGPVKDGGHFHNTTYGIRAEAASNTLFLFHPKHAHATSLMCVDPKDPNPPVSQRGLSISTST
ncbi:hypothetical protein K435DRAFT_664447, partial [Dendrothele bispora CBS 962.96]